MPEKFKCLLSLGLKYCTNDHPNMNHIVSQTKEAVRKLSWNIYFKINNSHEEPTEVKLWYHKNKKEFMKIHKIPGKKCPIDHDIFNLNTLIETVCKNLVISKPSSHLKILISEFKEFCTTNNILVIEADKNAGLCIVYQSDYDTEVMRQLQDLTTYHPTTSAHFTNSMIDFHDKLKCFQKQANLPIFLSTLLPTEDKPAKFYILPKIHKQFDKFPKGRPISSTFNKTNKYASKLLDFVLKPCTNAITDLLIDTQHFILLINNVKLNVNKKYTLVTVDIEALYPSLFLADCKKHCISTYENNDIKHLNLTNRQMNDLLCLSLEYNYVKYKEDWFYQHRGIEMGNSASVMVANITVFNEVKNVFNDINEVIFYKRFLDDIFLIVESDGIDNMHGWLTSKLVHRYLKFTFEFDNHSINFLDTTVKVINNKLQTDLFVKPMSKHLYLHATSNHPTHLKESLYYSQGLRIIRICSDFSTRTEKLLELFGKFKIRWYDDKKLYSTFTKLIYTGREQALQPKKKLLLEYLSVHNPDILTKYDLTEMQQRDTELKSKVHVIFPFYRNIYRYSETIKKALLENMKYNVDDEWIKHVDDIDIQVVFSRVKNMKELLQ